MFTMKPKVNHNIEVVLQWNLLHYVTMQDENGMNCEFAYKSQCSASIPQPSNTSASKEPFMKSWICVLPLMTLIVHNIKGICCMNGKEKTLQTRGQLTQKW